MNEADVKATPPSVKDVEHASGDILSLAEQLRMAVLGLRYLAEGATMGVLEDDVVTVEVMATKLVRMADEHSEQLQILEIAARQQAQLAA